MWRKQQPDGVVEGWHGDGNFARTSLMYALWKTRGVTPVGWREDLRLSAQTTRRGLRVMVAADSAWIGRLRFDIARHKQYMGMPVDYPRINQFPEWFTVEAGKIYIIKDSRTGNKYKVGGAELIKGLPVTIDPGRALILELMKYE